MVFSSPIFLFYFLPLVLMACFLAQRKIQPQNFLLFLSSVVFYFWGEKEHTLIVLISVLINYFAGILISRQKGEPARKLWLAAGIVFNLSILIYFKYYNFFVDEFLTYFNLGKGLNQDQKIHLPLGISFFTFHGITYIVDIYRREAKASKDLLNVSLYTLFFPQLIAGPIVRYVDISRQLDNRRASSAQINSGVKRFIIGLAKKIIIANGLGRIADAIYALQIADLSGSLIWFGIVVFALQLYYDFSGYSDMAIGLARIVGFEFNENFNFPYAARSLTDLWKRWHISLTTFFRNYVYIPLGGSKKGKARTYIHLLFVFFLTGLWHGASWNCILWGLFTGLFLVLEKIALGQWLQRLPYWLANIYTLFIFITALMIFKIEQGEHLADVLNKAFFLQRESSGIFYPGYYLTPDLYFLLIIAVIFVYPVHESKLYRSLQEKLRAVPMITEVLYTGLFLLTLSVMSSSVYNPFIYFKF